MGSYETSTAIHFIIFAIVFAAAFGFVAWRIVRNLERENESTSKDVTENADEDGAVPNQQGPETSN